MKQPNMPNILSVPVMCITYIEQCVVTGTTLSGHTQCQPGAIRMCLFWQRDLLEMDADFYCG